MRLPSNIRSTISRILNRYGILLAGVVIFAYYLWNAINLFENPQPKRTFVEYLFQFDTLIVLWILVVVVVKMSDSRKKQREQEEKNRLIVLEHEKQKMRLDMLDDVSAHLTDAINNPLSIIALSAGSLRNRFTTDREVVSFLDRIEAALRRLNEVLVDFQRYQTRKIIRGADPLVPHGRPSNSAEGSAS